MRDIAILGASGFAQQVAWSARRSGSYNVIAFIDETVTAPTEVDGMPVFQSGACLAKRFSDVALLAAVGSPQLRKRWAEQYVPDFQFVTIIDTSAIVAPGTKLGDGCVVLAGTVLSTSVSVGAHSLIGLNVCVSHDVAVGSFSHLGGGVILNGNSKVGNGCRIGSGAIILPGIEVGDDATVGAGALVTKNVTAGTTVAGMPARILRPIADRTDP